MILKDLIPKHLVLGQVIDDFADATTKVNYDIEDLCCYVINNIECYYWVNIESIWGPLGFKWISKDNYGRFNNTNIEFNKIPSVPDGHRIKRFDDTFERLHKDIEVYKSNWENVSEIYTKYDYKYRVFIFNSDYKIPEVTINYGAGSSNVSKYGWILRFDLSDTIIYSESAVLILDNESYKFYPFKSCNRQRDIIFRIYENIYNNFDLCLNNFLPSYITICENVTEVHMNVEYCNLTSNNYYSIIFDNDDISKNCTFYIHGVNNSKEGVFYLQFSSNVKDIIFVDIDNIRDKTIQTNIFNYCITKHYWWNIDKKLYNKLNSYLEYSIKFDNEEEFMSCPYAFNLNNDTTIYITDELYNKYIKTYRVSDNRNLSYFTFNFFPNYEYVTTKNFINNICVRHNRNNTYKLYIEINEEEITVDNILYLFNDTVKKVHGITYSYKNNDSYGNPIDIRKKEYIVLEEHFNRTTFGVPNYLIGTVNDDKTINYFDVDEIKPFDISSYTEQNIKNYCINYITIYSSYIFDIKKYKITQPLIISSGKESTVIDIIENYFAHLNTCEIRYIYRCKLTVNKDSVLTNEKFIEIINAYLFDNNAESAKGITLTIYTDYFNLIPEDKVNQFINDGYVINEVIN